MENQLTEKMCPKCAVIKSADLFYKSKSTKSGLRSYCKTCEPKPNPIQRKVIRDRHIKKNKERVSENNRKSAKAYRIRNPEKVKEATNKWRISNQEKTKQYARLYAKENAELLKQKRIINREIINERSKVWAKANRERRRELARKRSLQNFEEVNALSVLSQQTGLKWMEIRSIPELLETKIIQLKIKRLIKQNKKNDEN